MFGFLKIKCLWIGLLLAAPPVAAWKLRGGVEGGHPAEWVRADSQTANATANGPVQVPVEVVAKGSAPEWVYVEVAPETVPEPGVLPLTLLHALFFLRRRRG